MFFEEPDEAVVGFWVVFKGEMYQIIKRIGETRDYVLPPAEAGDNITINLRAKLNARSLKFIKDMVTISLSV